MAKNYKKFLLVFASALLLGACGNTPDNPDKPNDPKPEDPKPVEPEPGNTTIEFGEITNLIQINEKAQLFIDAMKAQENPDANPYLFTALDGYDKMDVASYLKQSDASKNRLITISWPDEYTAEDGMKLKVSTSNLFPADDTLSFDVTGTEYGLDNLLRATTYYYRLENADKSVQSQFESFTTADYVRKMNFDSVNKLNETIYNVRDEGGYISSFGGVRTTQGLIYRGSEINDVTFTYSGSHGINVDDSVLEKNKNIFKIGMEIDFRKDNAVSQTNLDGKSGINTEDFPVDYVRIPYQSYATFVNNPDGLKANAIKDVMELFANADEKHCYFHCWGGADRTGAMGFFLNGLLGMSLTDLYIDFDLTSQHNSLRSHNKANGDYDFPKMLKAIKDHELYSEDKTIAEFCYDWFLAQGVPAETLEKIRTIMIPGYETGMEQLTAYPEAE